MVQSIVKKALVIALLMCVGHASAQSTMYYDGSAVHPKDLYTQAPMTLYVDSGGNDANTCTLAKKCLTIKRALSLVPKTIRHAVTVHLGAGTFGGAWVEGFSVEIGVSLAAYLQIDGTMSTFTPAQGIASGTVTSFVQASGTTWSSVTVNGAGWAVNALRGKVINVTGGTGVGQQRLISDNTATTITFSGSSWSTSLTGTSTFAFLDWATSINSNAPSYTGDPVPIAGSIVPISAFVIGGGSRTGTNTGGPANPIGVLISRLKFVAGASSSIENRSPQTAMLLLCEMNGIDTSTRSLTFRPGGGEVLVRWSHAVGANSAGIVSAAYETGSPVYLDGNVHEGGAIAAEMYEGNSIQGRYNYFTGMTGTSLFQALTSNANNKLSSQISFIDDRVDSCASMTAGFISVATGASMVGRITALTVSNSNGGAGTFIDPNTYVKFVGYTGTTNSNTAFIVNTGARVQVDSTSTNSAGTDINIDGTTFTLAQLRALTPISIFNTAYGTAVFQ